MASGGWLKAGHSLCVDKSTKIAADVGRQLSFSFLAVWCQ